MADESKNGEGGVCVALDVGDTTAKVAVFHGDRLMVIANEQGNRVTPCAVSFTEHELLVGEAAGRKAAKNAKNTILGWRWFIGRKFSPAEVTALAKNKTIKITADADGFLSFTATTNGRAKTYTGPQLAALMFTTMRETAQAFLGKTVARAVVTVPAHFDETQRSAVAEAVAAAGMDAVRVLDEPVAAALGFGVDGSAGDSAATPTSPQRVVVFDMGGSCLSVSVLLVAGGLVRRLGHAYSTKAGGGAFDAKVMELCQTEFKRRTSMRVEGARSLARLRKAACIAKHALTRQPSAHVEVDSLFEGIDFGYNVSRVRFEYQASDVLKGISGVIDAALADVSGGLTRDAIDAVLMVGGASRMPCVLHRVSSYFGGASKLRTNVNAEEAVVMGAAREMQLLEVAVEAARMPEEAPVAMLAASVRVALSSGAAVVLLARGTPLPCRRQVTTSNAQDNQTSMCVEVLEGETAVVADCRRVGKLQLRGMAPVRRGKAVLTLAVVAVIDGSMQLSLTEQGGNGASATLVVRAPPRGSDDDSSGGSGDDDSGTAGAVSALCAPAPTTAAQETAYVAAAAAREKFLRTAARMAGDLATGASYLSGWSDAQRAVFAAGSAAAQAFIEAHPTTSDASADQWAEQHVALKNAFKAAAVMGAVAAAAPAPAPAASGDDDEEDDESGSDEEGSSDEDESSSDDEMVAPPPGVAGPAVDVVAPASDELD